MNIYEPAIWRDNRLFNTARLILGPTRPPKKKMYVYFVLSSFLWFDVEGNLRCMTLRHFFSVMEKQNRNWDDSCQWKGRIFPWPSSTMGRGLFGREMFQHLVSRKLTWRWKVKYDERPQSPIPSGDLTKLLEMAWTWPFIVDLPIKNDDFQ